MTDERSCIRSPFGGRKISAAIVRMAAGCCIMLPLVWCGQPVMAQLNDGSHRLAVVLPDEATLRSVTVDPQVRALVAQLDDASFQTREAATQALLEVAPDRMHLYAMLVQEELSTEQRYRLLEVIREHLLRTPRGALGISMRIAPLGDHGMGIQVTDFVQGLPAQRVLQVGDIITHIDGTPVTDNDQVIARVQTKRPGEKVMLTIHRAQVDEQGRILRDARGAEILEIRQIELELGSAELLSRAGTPGVTRSVVLEQRQREAAVVYELHQPTPKKITIRGELTLRDDETALGFDSPWRQEQIRSQIAAWEHALRTHDLTAEQRQVLLEEIERYRRLLTQ